jgi:hypothetical protein
MKSSLKSLLCVVVVLALTAGATHAACGKKDTTEGTLTSMDADTKTVKVKAADGKEVKLTLTATTVSKDGSGETVDAKELVGKQVVVVSEHAKVDSITEQS